MLCCALACVLLTYCGLYRSQAIQKVLQLGYVCAIPCCICVRLCYDVLYFVTVQVLIAFVSYLPINMLTRSCIGAMESYFLL